MAAGSSRFSSAPRDFEVSVESDPGEQQAECPTSSLENGDLVSNQVLALSLHKEGFQAAPLVLGWVGEASVGTQVHSWRCKFRKELG